jgi:predicted HicB family RNase H-like nuclease
MILTKKRNHKKRKKTITRTFRIKDDWDIILHEEAERQNISVNTLIDKILRRYALFDRYTDRINILN